MSFDSDIEHSDVESIGSRAHVRNRAWRRSWWRSLLFRSRRALYGWAYCRRWMVSGIQLRSWTERTEKPGVAKSLWQDHWNRELVSVRYFSPLNHPKSPAYFRNRDYTLPVQCKMKGWKVYLFNYILALLGFISQVLMWPLCSRSAAKSRGMPLLQGNWKVRRITWEYGCSKWSGNQSRMYYIASRFQGRLSK